MILLFCVSFSLFYCCVITCLLLWATLLPDLNKWMIEKLKNKITYFVASNNCHNLCMFTIDYCYCFCFRYNRILYDYMFYCKYQVHYCYNLFKFTCTKHYPYHMFLRVFRFLVQHNVAAFVTVLSFCTWILLSCWWRM